MKNKVTLWQVITLVLALIAASCIFVSAYVSIPHLFKIGIVILVFAELSSIHMQCLRKKSLTET